MTKLFREVQSAYDVLMDPQERAWYDKHKDAILMKSGVYEDNEVSIGEYFSPSCYSGYGWVIIFKDTLVSDFWFSHLWFLGQTVIITSCMNSILIRLFLSENVSETLQWSFYRPSIKGLSSRAFLKISLLADFWHFFENVSKTHPFTFRPYI